MLNTLFENIENGFYGVRLTTALGIKLERNRYVEKAGHTTARAVNITTGALEVELGRESYVGITNGSPVIYASGTNNFNKIVPQKGVTRNSTVGATLHEHESGLLCSNSNATALVTFSLPAAKPGLEYSFRVDDADGIKVQAGTGDTIRIGTSVSAAAGFVQSTELGATIYLTCTIANKWIASASGTWTVT